MTPSLDRRLSMSSSSSSSWWWWGSKKGSRRPLFGSLEAVAEKWQLFLDRSSAATTTWRRTTTTTTTFVGALTRPSQRVGPWEWLPTTSSSSSSSSVVMTIFRGTQPSSPGWWRMMMMLLATTTAGTVVAAAVAAFSAEGPRKSVVPTTPSRRNHHFRLDHATHHDRPRIPSHGWWRATPMEEASLPEPTTTTTTTPTTTTTTTTTPTPNTASRIGWWKGTTTATTACQGVPAREEEEDAPPAPAPFQDYVHLEIVERGLYHETHVIYGHLLQQHLVESYHVYQHPQTLALTPAALVGSSLTPPAAPTNFTQEPLVVAVVQLGRLLDGHPGVVHGGMLALLMDDVCGLAFLVMGIPMAYTANLNMNYRQPVPAGTTVALQVTLQERQERKLYYKITMTSPDRSILYCEATSLFIIPKNAPTTTSMPTAPKKG